MEAYDHVVVVKNLDEQTTFDKQLQHDLVAFDGGYMHIGYQVPPFLSEQLKLKLTYKSSDLMDFNLDRFSQSAIQMENVNLIAESSVDAITYGELYSVTENKPFPYAVLHNSSAYLSFFLANHPSELAAGYVIKDWLGIEQEGQLYLFINEIYPYSDLERLREISKQLYDAGIPFIVSVNPIFTNLDYPAAQHYLETMKYIQFHNGSIIVDAPSVSYVLSADRTVINQKMATFINWLADNDIVPLGTSAELYWFFDEYYLYEGMDFYDSAIILENKNISYYSPTDHTHAFNTSLYSIDFTQWYKYTTKTSTLDRMPFNIALTINYVDEINELESYIDTLLKSWILFHDFKFREHSVSTENNQMGSDHGVLHINSNILAKNNTFRNIDTDYEYFVKETAAFERTFTIQNNILIIIIIVVLIVFGLFLINGYKMYKNKFIDRGM